MNKTRIVGAGLAFAAAAAVAGIAGYAVVSEEQEALDRPAVAGQTPAVAEQNCYEAEIERPAEPADEKRIAGTAIGAVIGGAVGNDVGDSDLTTAAGAAAGAFAGNQAQKRFQENRTETATGIRCD